MVLLRLIDRHVLRAFSIQYAIYLTGFLFTFTAVDFLRKLEDFVQIPKAADRVSAILAYYGSQYLVLFNLLNPATTVLATIFVLSVMERHNELLILRATGVSLYRALRALFLGAAITAAAALWIQDAVLPSNGAAIINNIKNLKARERKRVVPAPRLKDDQDRLYYMQLWDPETKEMLGLTVTVQGIDQKTQTIYRDTRAAWAPGRDGAAGGWRLRGGIRIDEASGDRRERPVPSSGGDLLVSSLTPEDVDASTANLWEFYPYRELRKRAERQPWDPNPRLQMHLRILGPLYTATLFLLGLPFGLLGRSRGFLHAGFFCLALCGSFYGTMFFLRGMATKTDSFLSPVMAAWLPILLFLPIALWFLRAVRT